MARGRLGAILSPPDRLEEPSVWWVKRVPCAGWSLSAGAVARRGGRQRLALAAWHRHTQVGAVEGAVEKGGLCGPYRKTRFYLVFFWVLASPIQTTGGGWVLQGTAGLAGSWPRGAPIRTAPQLPLWNAVNAEDRARLLESIGFTSSCQIPPPCERPTWRVGVVLRIRTHRDSRPRRLLSFTVHAGETE